MLGDTPMRTGGAQWVRTAHMMPVRMVEPNVHGVPPSSTLTPLERTAVAPKRPATAPFKEGSLGP